MRARRNSDALSWTLMSVGALALGFAVGLRRLIWGLFWVLAVLWCLFAFHSSGPSPSLVEIAVAVGPPIVVALGLKFIDRVVRVFVDDLRGSTGASPAFSGMNGQSEQGAESDTSFVDEPDYYSILEVAQTASPETIRAAFKSLVQRYHPDRNPGDATATRQTQLLNDAYSVLSDPLRRADYDARRGRAGTNRKTSATRFGASFDVEDSPPQQATHQEQRSSAAYITNRGRDVPIIVILASLGIVATLGLGVYRAVNVQGTPSGPATKTAARGSAVEPTGGRAAISGQDSAVHAPSPSGREAARVEVRPPVDGVHSSALSPTSLSSGERVTMQMACATYQTNGDTAAYVACRKRQQEIARSEPPAPSLAALDVDLRVAIEMACERPMTAGDLVEYRACLRRQVAKLH